MHDVNGGDYQTDLIVGKPNTDYFIEVKIDDKVYSAESYMPAKTEIDSLSYELAQKRPGGDRQNPRYIIHVYFKDEPMLIIFTDSRLLLIMLLFLGLLFLTISILMEMKLMQGLFSILKLSQLMLEMLLQLNCNQ